jgi:hypothetical protein
MTACLIFGAVLLKQSRKFSPGGHWVYEAKTMKSINAPAIEMHGRYGIKLLTRHDVALRFAKDGKFCGEGLKGTWAVTGNVVTITVTNRPHALEYLQARKPGTVNDTEMTYSSKTGQLTWWDAKVPRESIFKYVRP